MPLLTKVALSTSILLWASAFSGIRVGLAGYAPLHLALLRFLIASLALGMLAGLVQTRRPALADLPRIFGAGFFGVAAYNVTLNYGELTVSAGAASFIVNTMPIFTTLLAVIFLHERVRLLGWLGMGISFMGVGLIALGDGADLKLGLGAWFVFSAALCQSLCFVLQKPLLAKYSPFEVASYAIWCGTACLLIFSPGLFTAITTAPTPATIAVVYLGLFPAALAYLTWSYALSKLPASQAAAALYLAPLVSVIIAYLWLGETLTWLTLLGGILALGGVIMVNRVKVGQAPLKGAGLWQRSAVSKSSTN